MNNKSRLENSFFNFISGIGYRLVTLISAFVVRTVFVKCLNAEYLGINGLYSNILTVLSLAELGFGTAMVYSMYKPLANNDEKKLIQLLVLYKKVYSIIGMVVLLIGLCLVPFLDVLVKDQPNIEGLKIYYILFLINSVASYWFFAYRTSLLQADQKSYIITNYNTVFNLIKSILQIIVLLVFHNFSLYLISQIVCTIAQNICIAIKTKKLYPFISSKERIQLPKEEKVKIFNDVKALTLSKIGHVALNGTDNIIISSFIGVKQVGLLSNFIMISDAVTAVLCQLTASVSASLGNYFVKEDKESGFILFRRVDFLNNWLYGFSLIALITLLNPLIYIWLGEDYMMENSVIVWLSINFFVSGFLNTLYTFRAALGLFNHGIYRPIIITVINIAMSIILSFKFGVSGVLAATFISRLCVSVWYDPLLIHKYGFNKSVKPYYIRLILRSVLLAIAVLLLQLISSYVFEQGITIFRFAIMVVITAIVPNTLFLLVYFKTDEFEYFKNILFKRLRIK